MAVSIFCNTIPAPDRGKAVQQAVLAGIGTRPESETWKIQIFEPQSSTEYVIKIEGPNDFKWDRTFVGPEEEAPEFICNEVHSATQSI